MDSIKAVAVNNSMSESKVKSMLYRTRLGLKEHLEKEGFSL
jgi:RNA polymerase sigma-70 factor (ECF subfamily)